MERSRFPLAEMLEEQQQESTTDTPARTRAVQTEASVAARGKLRKTMVTVVRNELASGNARKARVPRQCWNAPLCQSETKPLEFSLPHLVAGHPSRHTAQPHCWTARGTPAPPPSCLLRGREIYGRLGEGRRSWDPRSDPPLGMEALALLALLEDNKRPLPTRSRRGSSGILSRMEVGKRRIGMVCRRWMGSCLLLSSLLVGIPSGSSPGFTVPAENRTSQGSSGAPLIIEMPGDVYEYVAAPLDWWHADGYCQQRFAQLPAETWEGTHSVPVLVFRNKTDTKFVRVLADFPAMPAVSACAHIQWDPGAVEISTVFSYAVPAFINEFQLRGFVDEEGLVRLALLLHGHHSPYLPVFRSDGQWHHVCLTWRQRNGSWAIHADGKERAAATGLSAWQALASQGTFIIGQDQDALGGAFKEKESFSGNITGLQVWRRVLSREQLEKVRSCLSVEEGLVFGWSTDILDVEASVQQATVQLTCPGPVEECRVLRVAPGGGLTYASCLQASPFACHYRKDLYFLLKKTQSDAVPPLIARVNARANATVIPESVFQAQEEAQGLTLSAAAELLGAVERVLREVEPPPLDAGALLGVLQLLRRVSGVEEAEQPEQLPVLEQWGRRYVGIAGMLLEEQNAQQWSEIGPIIGGPMAMVGSVDRMASSLQRLLSTERPTVSIRSKNVGVEVRQVTLSTLAASSTAYVTRGQPREQPDWIEVPAEEMQGLRARGLHRITITNTWYSRGSLQHLLAGSSPVFEDAAVSDGGRRSWRSREVHGEPGRAWRTGIAALSNSRPPAAVPPAPVVAPSRSLWRTCCHTICVLPSGWGTRGRQKPAQGVLLAGVRQPAAKKVPDHPGGLLHHFLHSAQRLRGDQYLGALPSPAPGPDSAGPACGAHLRLLELQQKSHGRGRVVLHGLLRRLLLRGVHRLCLQPHHPLCRLAAGLRSAEERGGRGDPEDPHFCGLRGVVLRPDRHLRPLPGSRSVCFAVTAFLHLFFMAAFAWMLVEGLLLWSKVVAVNMSEDRRMRFYYVTGWGLPVLIVGVTLATSFNNYVADNHCWLNVQTDIIWAFVGPVLFVLTVNTFVLFRVVMVTVSSARRRSRMLTPNSSLEKQIGVQIWATAKPVLVLLPVLGLTWVCGVLVHLSITWAYIFIVLNSLQGLYIFLVYAIYNSEVRNAIQRMKEKKKALSFTNCSHPLNYLSSPRNTSWEMGKLSPSTPEDTASPSVEKDPGTRNSGSKGNFSAKMPTRIVSRMSPERPRPAVQLTAFKSSGF
ncbi:adhesion G-protein coupled receptor D2 isoform X3 [Hemicordylus capensis]|uniref:adhesion G-protein coupled receptor D2 isoform X3 n=1 Tax=Hemicordylus capensis TaxID=884348 RepID=UPI0023020BA9|nr:adhesion G-protein coupled receptor D2 isoform X3 [Hemicordylus capensis]